MNVALPAFVIFVLLLPGFIFRTRVKRVERSSLDYSPFGQVVAEAVIWAIVAHLAWLSASNIQFVKLTAADSIEETNPPVAAPV